MASCYFMRSSVMQIMRSSLEDKIVRIIVRCRMVHYKRYSLRRSSVISRCCKIKRTPCISVTLSATLFNLMTCIMTYNFDKCVSTYNQILPFVASYSDNFSNSTHIIVRFCFNSFPPERLLSRRFVVPIPPDRLLSRRLTNICSLRYGNTRPNQSTANFILA